MLRILLGAVLLCGSAAAETNLSFGSGNDGMKTWKSGKGGIEFDYPADWGPEKGRADGGVQLFRSGKGWFELSLIDLPEGEDPAGFSQHLIKKSKGEGWDLRLEADLGEERIEGKVSWVHKYRHKKKKRTYYGYHFVPENGTVGIRVLMVKISRKGGKAMMGMLRSLRYPGSDAPPAAPAVQAAVEKKRPAKAPEPSGKEEAGVSDDAAAHTEFGTYQSEGIVKGRVLLKRPRDKSAYPCYLVFHPLRSKGGRRRSKDLEDYDLDGEPIRTATDDRGRYRADLEEGAYMVEVYDSEGNNWPVLRGELFHRSRAKKLHNVRIDNIR